MLRPKIHYSLEHRVALYNSSYGTRYPNSRLYYHNGFFSGVWMLGRNYKGSGFYGSYPPQYLSRMGAMFPDITGRDNLLHIFSGSLPKSNHYTRVDMLQNADIAGNVEKLSSLIKGKRKGIYADPPYSDADAVKYGTPMPNRKKVLEECSKVLLPGGFVIWLDTVWPMISKDYLKLVGLISINRSQNHRGRQVYIMQKAGRL